MLLLLPKSVIHQSHSLWSTDSSTVLILSSSPSSLISLMDFTILTLHPAQLVVTHQLLRPHLPAIINLTNIIQLIINPSHKSHLTNLISLVHLTVTSNSLVTLLNVCHYHCHFDISSNSNQ